MSIPPKKKSTLSRYALLEESVLQAFRNTLTEGLASGVDKLVEKVADSVEDFGEAASICFVTGGPDDIRHFGTRTLLHQFEVWVVYLSRDIEGKDVVARQKNIAGYGYDLIMDDITLSGEVLKVIPLRIESGHMLFAEEVFVGVFQRWVAWKTEGFTI